MKIKKSLITNDFLATTRFVTGLQEVATSNPDAKLTAIFFGGKLIIVPKCLQGFARLLLELAVQES